MTKSLHDQSGVAILMVITSVALLSFMLVDFTFETKVNKLKIYNTQDKFQARLNAEAGLNFALAKLRIYQEARNLLEENEQAKSVIKPEQIEEVLLEPFMFPIPELPGLSVIQREALKEFEESILFNGEVSINIKPVSGFLNPNNMRVSAKKDEDRQDNQFNNAQGDDGEDRPPELYMEETLIETMTQLFEDKTEEDRSFDIKYGNLDPEMLIKELKFYISDKELFDDAERGELESRYLSQNVRPKYAPLSSLDELYLLLGWPDEIVDLIKDKLTVHEVAIIAVNEITESQLKILFPDITPFQIEEFFRFRNGDQERGEDPNEFETADDFKKLIVDRLGVTDSERYDQRLEEFENAGLKIGIAGKLYQVSSQGKKGRAEYNLVAYVDMPIKPQPEKPKVEGATDAPPGDLPDDQFNSQNNGQGDLDQNQGENAEEKTEYMTPRVVEIRVE